MSFLALRNLSILAASDNNNIEAPFHWARVKFDVERSVPDKWDIHPSGDQFFLSSLKKYTNINVDENWHVADLGNIKEMQKYPFLFMTADGDFSCSRKQLLNLKEYLLRGGFLFAEDCVYQTRGDRFFRGLKAKLEDAFNTKMVKLPKNHEIYHCFFDLENGLPYYQGINHGGYGLFLDNRLAVFLSPSDIHCAWTDLDRQLNRRIMKRWFPGKNTRDAIKMGINIVTYAMTH